MTKRAESYGYDEVLKMDAGEENLSWGNIFAGGWKGDQIQFDMENLNMIKKHGYYNEGCIMSQATTHDNRYLFVGCADGRLSQFDVKKQKEIKNYGKMIVNSFSIYGHEPNSIRSMAITKDDKYLFVGDEQGRLFQFHIKQQMLIKKYGNICDISIMEMFLISDDRFLFIKSEEGYITQFDIQQQIIVKDYGEELDYDIFGMAITKDDRYLFVVNPEGYIWQYDINEQTLIDEWEQFIEEAVLSIAITDDSQFLFIQNTDSKIYQVNIPQKKLVRTFRIEGNLREMFIIENEFLIFYGERTQGLILGEFTPVILIKYAIQKQQTICTYESELYSCFFTAICCTH